MNSNLKQKFLDVGSLLNEGRYLKDVDTFIKGKTTAYTSPDHVKDRSMTSITKDTEVRSNNEDRIHAVRQSILKNYATDRDGSFFLFNQMDSKKLNSFGSKVIGPLGLNVSLDEFREATFAYFDETLFGSGSKGVAVGVFGVICNADSLFRVPLNEIREVQTSGLINKDLIIVSSKNGKFRVTLTQGNKGVLNIKEIANNLVKNLDGISFGW